MIRYLRPIVLGLLAALTIPVAFAADNCAGCKDYPGISRMPGHSVTEFKEQQFDSFTFTTTEAGKEKKVPVEGHLYKYTYRLDRGAAPASALQILRNFQNAVRASGGQVLWESGEGNNRTTTLRFNKGANEVWLQVTGLSGVDKMYFLTIVEKQAMQQDVTVDAKAMADGLTATGHVEVPGIFFDFGKSQPKPESDAAIKEIAKLLKANTAMKLWVVGHTDSVGSPEANLTLSGARAAAVIQTLTQKNGIDPKRLAPFGNGPYAPVATNDSEEGRARNRRVELVKHL
ncbi:MAG: OmpA family protein [Bryobacteraceae bacterium]|jgi:outer membrane protein OmpA-like peptidoglycan-associated protein